MSVFKSARGEHYKNDLMDDLRDPVFAAAYVEAARADSPESLEVALRDLAALDAQQKEEK